MALDFPSSPAVGQACGGRVWDGALWKAAPIATALPKNYIVNPAMQISQQMLNAAVVPAGPFYLADQWTPDTYVVYGTDMSVQRVEKATPGGSPYRLRGTVLANNKVDFFGFVQQVEAQRFVDLGYGTGLAKPSVFRFGVSVGMAGTLSVRIINMNTYEGWDHFFTVLPGQINTDLECIVPLQIFGVASGAWPSGNASGAYIEVKLIESPSFAPINSIFELFDVGWYADPYATGVAPPFEIPDYAAELRRCQRYWYRCMALQGGVANATTIARVVSTHPAPMRIKPAVALVGAPGVSDGTVTRPITSIDFNASDTQVIELNMAASAGGMTTGRGVGMYYATDNDYISVSARM